MTPRSRALISKLDAVLSPVAKAPDANVVQVLSDAQDRIGAVLTQVEAANGVLPDGMAAEIATVAAMLLTLAPGQAPPVDPTAPPVVPGVATPSAGAVMMQAKFVRGEVTKAELDAYTARKVTIDAAQSRMWRMQDLFCQGKDADGMAELKGITDMLNNVVQTTSAAPGTGAAAPATDAAKSTVTLTAEQFAAWSVDQVRKSATEPTKVEARKRLNHLKEVTALAKAYFFEETSTPATPAFTVEMLTAYAPEGPGKVDDLTTKSDQVSGENANWLTANNGGSPQQTSLGLNLPANGGNALASPAFPWTADTGGNNGKPQQTNLGEGFAKSLDGVLGAVDAMVKALAEGEPPAAGAVPPAAAPVTKAALPVGDDIWPSDLAQVMRDEEAERKGVKKNADLHFGRDPQVTAAR